MTQCIVYLSFNGNCREAMEFYQDCLGGELEIQSLSDSPKGFLFPEFLKSKVLQASLKYENMVLMGTDLQDEVLVKGNNISVFLKAKGINIRKYYNNLTKGGSPTYPLKQTDWGGVVGGLTDKYGVRWILQCNKY